MTTWSEDFSGRDLAAILQSQSENRAWGKELRRRNSALVNSRLAHVISQADYLTDRKLVQDDSLEYRRRATLLDAQLNQRSTRPLLSAN